MRVRETMALARCLMSALQVVHDEGVLHRDLKPANIILQETDGMPRATLIDRVWGSDYVGDTKTLDVHVKRLRAKVEDDPSQPTRIVTIRGLGYKFAVAKNVTR